MRTGLSGDINDTFLVVYPQGTFTLSSGTFDFFAASQPMRIYADPGSSVEVLLTRSDTSSSNGGVIFSFSGYLVGIP
jgi:hypothetical protein